MSTCRCGRGLNRFNEVACTVHDNFVVYFWSCSVLYFSRLVDVLSSSRRRCVQSCVECVKWQLVWCRIVDVISVFNFSVSSNYRNDPSIHNVLYVSPQKSSKISIWGRILRSTQHTVPYECCYAVNIARDCMVSAIVAACYSTFCPCQRSLSCYTKNKN